MEFYNKRIIGGEKMEYILTVWINEREAIDFRFATDHDLAMFIRDIITYMLRKQIHFVVEKVKTNDG